MKKKWDGFWLIVFAICILSFWPLLIYLIGYLGGLE